MDQSALTVLLSAALTLVLQWAKGHQGGGRYYLAIAHIAGAAIGFAVWWATNGDGVVGALGSAGIGALVPVGAHQALKNWLPALSEAVKTIGRANAPKTG